MSAPQCEVSVLIPAGEVTLVGALELPPLPTGVVVFSHGSGSGRNSPRNQFVATQLRRAGLATLLLDLLTAAEDENYARRFDIDLLTVRLGHAVRFVQAYSLSRELPLGLFGASTGAAAALRVASSSGAVRAVVSRGGRPDLVNDAALARVTAPTLLIVGGSDFGVIELNEAARDALVHCEHKLAIVPGATHLFEEPGALEEVGRLAAQWFTRHLTSIPIRLKRACR